MESYKLYATAIDPVYIGTGGYTIGRVDNTIVRDQITRLPKIPGTSLAGTWRYYTALKLHAYFKDNYKNKRDIKQNLKELLREDLLKQPGNHDWAEKWEGNKYASVACAGQDVSPENQPDQTYVPSGHCTKCVVCHTFGYSKSKNSRQGRAYFSDMRVLLFPVSTIFGVKWITSPRILMEAFPGGDFSGIHVDSEQALGLVKGQDAFSFINFGWIRLRKAVIEDSSRSSALAGKLSRFGLKAEDVYILSDAIISQIVNANLEVRTSVSINPLTGTAKEGALFTTEAIPRATIFFGEVRIHEGFTGEEPSSSLILSALKESAVFYSSLGIGGMVTRGFGRIRIVWDEEANAHESA